MISSGWTDAEGARRIYHIVREEDFHNKTSHGAYTPASLAAEGFIHCSTEANVLPVADRYCTGESAKLILLRIDPEKLTSTVKCERAAPPDGGIPSAMEAAEWFPHIYGPLEISAITGYGYLEKTSEGFRWPKEFYPLTGWKKT